MLNKVKTYIAQHNLLDTNKKHIVALSGGADSVCLLLIMRELGYDVHAAHCNFHLRGEESERDEMFCRELCERNDVPFHFTHFDTVSFAKLHKISIEMAARDLRYSYFEALRKAIGAEDIIVAHHKNDNAETFLMNIMRGTGIKGLEGIKPRNGAVVRPLLCVSRAEIEEYLRKHGQNYVTDSTNLVADVVRNKIRLNVIPMLEEIMPATSENIIKTIHNVMEASKMLDAAVKTSMGECVTKNGDILCIDIDKLKQQPSPEYVLFMILSPLDFTSSQISQIIGNLDGQTGKIWQSNSNTLVIDRGFLLVCNTMKSGKTTQLSIPESGLYAIDENEKLSIGITECTETFVPSKEPYAITIDADRVTFPLKLRTVMPSDRFQPFGMKGSKLVSDYLTDRKRNYFQRQQQLVLEDFEGKIIWLVGERVSQAVAYTQKTIKILSVRYIINEE